MLRFQCCGDVRGWVEVEGEFEASFCIVVIICVWSEAGKGGEVIDNPSRPLPLAFKGQRTPCCICGEGESVGYKPSALDETSIIHMTTGAWKEEARARRGL